DGLLNEVVNVLALIEEDGRAVNKHSLSSMQAIGYKEIVRHLSGELGLDEAVKLIKQRSRNYAKRQYTWFRKEEGIQWIDITGIFNAVEITSFIESEVKMHEKL
ncbi:MAG: hypothetical protein LLF86_01860, partial [Nitrospiraceae bacterium]|nr:hypothetical protein [Nitrospiraceae bacterium]